MNSVLLKYSCRLRIGQEFHLQYSHLRVFRRKMLSRSCQMT